MNAFRSALANEVSQARASLLRARERHDEAAMTDAVERLHDLDEISARVRDGLTLVTAPD
ncbi:hypothetical protein [Phycicoccus sp. Soil748]|uniref:hypothetical protein n=1 Tax=Intrasporangiaceae TaxID=85021 RepID=UPI0007038BD9|nr:hypothetical protein [Phycicoccus sp. Soil748]KRE58872.1 hypothetical protein ASG70_16630 [Phycicoccus sp. Soil748]